MPKFTVRCQCYVEEIAFELDTDVPSPAHH